MTEEVKQEQTSTAQESENKIEDKSQDLEKLQVNYENVRTALRVEREKRRQAEELLKRQSLEEDDDTDDEEDTAKLRREISEVRHYGELIKLMNSDSFVKDNISDIQEIMENNKLAIRMLKKHMFDIDDNDTEDYNDVATSSNESWSQSSSSSSSS